MVAAGVDEQLAKLGPDRRDQLTRSVDVALVCEERVILLAVNLNGDAVGPGAERVFTGDREAGFVQQRALSRRPRLGQPLSRADAHEKPAYTNASGNPAAAAFAFASGASPSSFA